MKVRWGLGLLLVLTVLSWGYYQWQQNRFWCEGCVKSYRFNLAKKPYLKGSNYIINYKDVTFLAPKWLMGQKQFFSLETGDSLEVVGKRDPTATTFSKRQISLIKLSIVSSKTSPPGVASVWGWLGKWVSGFREQAFVRIRSFYGEPEASLITGLTLGNIDGMPKDFYEALVKTGTLHVVAASGTNVSLVLATLLSVGVTVMPRGRALVLGVVGIVVYVLLAGGEAPVARAALMGGLAVLAEATGREYQAAWGFVLVALGMVLFLPWILVSLSFQLSVAATAGIVFGNRTMRSFWRKLSQPAPCPERVKAVLSEELSITSSALLATLPVSLAAFGSVPLLSLVANVLIAWMIIPLTLLGGLILGLGLVVEPVGWVVSWLSHPLLKMLIALVRQVALLDWGVMEVTQWSWWWGLGWWLLLAGWWGRTDAKRV